MKLLLQILWGWSVLANGAVGIQVGTVQTNNQNIKIMKMNFTSPVWLQSASNVGNLNYTFICQSDDPKVILSGTFNITSIKNGKKNMVSYSDIEDQEVTILSDSNKPIVIDGNLTKFNVIKYGSLVSTITLVDFSQNIDLEYLDLSYNPQLSSIDIKSNSELKYFNCSGCEEIDSLDLSTNIKLETVDCFRTNITSIDLSNNPNITRLFVGENSSLKTVNAISCPSLSNLNLNSASGLVQISIRAIIQDVANGVASAISDAESVNGTVTLRQGDEFNQTIIDAAMEKGWDVQYAE